MSARDGRNRSTPSLVAFYLLALGVSWGLWAPWVWTSREAPAQPTPSWGFLHLLGSLGPCVAALIVTGWTGGKERLAAFVRGLASARGARVALAWGALLPAAMFVVSALGMGWRQHTPVRWGGVGVAPEYPWLGPGAYVLASLFFYGVGEEIGWRGFVYPALRRRLSPLPAALLVVPFWALWHVPLFFATESYRAMGVSGAIGWLMSLASGSVLAAWLTERAAGSLLPAIVLHAVLDVFFLADVGVPVQSPLGALVTIWGVVVAVGLARQVTGHRALAVAAALAVMVAGCGGAAKPQLETAARLKDSAPEKAASQRAAAGGLDLEHSDDRWGIEAAKERRRAEDQNKAARAADKRVDVRR